MSKQDPKELYDFLAPFIALCRKGMNKKTFFLKKSDSEDEMKNGKITAIIKKAVLSEKIQKEFDNLNPSNSEFEVEEIEGLKAAMKLIVGLKEKIGQQLAHEISEALSFGYGGNKGDNNMDEKELEKMKKEFEDKIKEKDEEIEKVKKELEDVKKLGEEKKPAEVADASNVEPVQKSDGSIAWPKSYSKEQIAVLEPIVKSNFDLKKKLEVELNEKKEKEFIAKSDSIKGLSVKSDELGKILKSIDEKAGKEIEDKIFNILKSASEIIEKSPLFKEIGSGHGNGATSAEDKINVEVEAIMKSEAGKGLSKEQVYDRVLKANPALYSEYINETNTRS